MAQREATDPHNSYRPHYAMRAAIASIVTVAFLIVLKVFAFWISGSVSILATLIDSIADAVVSIINFLAIRYSLKPADREHRFGHGKIEGLAALFQSAFIVGAGMFLALESVSRFAAPPPVEKSMIAVVVMLISIVLSALLVIVQNNSLRFSQSLAVEADRAHYAGDIAVNGGVLAILLILHFGGPYWIDPVFGLGVALYLFYVAYDIAMKGVDMLLDRELPDEQREQIEAIVKRNPDVRGMHDLRTRKSGMYVHISFDIDLDPEQSLKDAHDIAIALEQQLLALFPNAEIMIHKDPEGIHHTDSRHRIAGEPE